MTVTAARTLIWPNNVREKVKGLHPLVYRVKMPGLSCEYSACGSDHPLPDLTWVTIKLHCSNLFFWKGKFCFEGIPPFTRKPKVIVDTRHSHSTSAPLSPCRLSIQPYLAIGDCNCIGQGESLPQILSTVCAKGQTLTGSVTIGCADFICWPLIPPPRSCSAMLLTTDCMSVVFFSQCGCWLHPFDYLRPLTFHWFSPAWRDPILHGSGTWPLSRSSLT